MSNRKRPTRADVAARANVSTAIVSAVLSEKVGGTIRTSAATAARVRRAAEELNYSPNVAARSLAKGRNGLLGVYTFTAVFPAEQNDFYQPFLLGIEREAEAQEHDLLLFTSTAGGANGRRRIYRNGGNRLRLADGCILLGQDPDRSEVVHLADEDFPFVFIGRREVPGRPDPAFVAADYRSAVVDVVEMLLELGHTGICYLRSPGSLEAFQDRRRGYADALERNRGRIHAEVTLPHQPEGIATAQLRDIVALGVTAFIAEGDAWRGVMSSAEHAGYRLPDDLSLVVLGDPPGLATPELTRLVIPRREMGAAAVRMLVSMLGVRDIEDRRHIFYAPEIVLGRTHGAAPPAVNR